jgi:hypothetical protein
MRAIALALLAVAMPAEAQAADPTDKAADHILKQCVEHALGNVQIKGQNAKQLEADGFVYQLDPPEFLSSTKQSDLGRAEYIKSPSDQGEIWAAGYDGGSCLVVTAAAEVAPIEKAYLAYFTQPGAWHSERASSGQNGERRLQYAMQPTRATKLTAMISLRDGDGVTSVTIRRGVR